MKAKHLAFAKAHQHWSKVLFSDQLTIQQFVAMKQNDHKLKRDTMGGIQF